MLACLPGCWPPLDEVAAPPSASERYRALVLADAPLAYWPLDEQAGATMALDATSNHHDAMYLGPITRGPGPMEGGSAAMLDGNMAAPGGLCTRIVVGGGFDFPDYQEFTIEAWIQPSMASVNSVRIAAKANPGKSGPTSGYELITSRWADRPGLAFQRSDGDPNTCPEDTCQTEANITDISVPSTTRFTHVVITSASNKTITLFVNGVTPPDGMRHFVWPADKTTFSFVWGASSDGRFCFPGALAELAIYDKVLSTDRISAHVQAGQPAP